MYSSPKLHAYIKTRFKHMHLNVCHLIKDTRATEKRQYSKRSSSIVINDYMSLPATNVVNGLRGSGYTDTNTYVHVHDLRKREKD